MTHRVYTIIVRKQDMATLWMYRVQD